MATRRRISGGHALVVVHGLIVAVTAIPLVLARWGRAALRRASLVASLLLFAVVPVGLLLGLAVYLPAALLLLLAAGLADPQSRPQLTTVLVTAGVVVGVVVTVLFAGGFSREWLRFH